MCSFLKQGLLDGGLFLDSACGSIFLRLMGPAGQVPEHWVVLIPPFAEEMNKSRRMLGLVSRALSRHGIGAVILDLFGTGDSQGDFSEARVDVWRRDITQVVAWLREVGATRVQALCVRLGALLALDAYCHRELALDGMIFWSPVPSGQLAMTQFLRLRMAAGLLGSEGAKETTSDLRAILAEGQSLEVAGYELSSGLFGDINALRLDVAEIADLPPIYWLDVVQDASRGVLPASQRVVNAWTEKGVHVEADCVEGDAFWGTQEISEVPALIDKTIQYVCRV